MTCEHYERVGALRAERGEADPHRDTCEACTTEHAMRRAIIAALPLVDADAIGDPNWQQGVWRAIERDEAARRAQPVGARWFVGSAFASACVLLAVSWIVIVRDPHIQTSTVDWVARRQTRGERSRIGHVGDSVHVQAASSADVRVYRENEMIRWCAPGATSSDCTVDGDKLIVDVEARWPGTYHVIIATRRDDTPPGSLPVTNNRLTDLSALPKAKADIATFELEAR